MARLGRMEIFVVDAAGNALSGVDIEFRRAGALTNGTTGPTTIDCNTVGSILVSDTVRDDLDGASDVINAIISETQFSTAGVGWGSVADGRRMTVTSPLPTVYNAEDGTESVTQPGISTDADGFATVYAENGFYDVHSSGGGATTELRQNVMCVGGTTTIIYIVGTGSTEHWIWDTGRALASGDDHTVWKVLGSKLMALDDSGKLTLVGVGGLTTDGAIVNTAGGLTIVGNSEITGTLDFTSTTSLVVASGGVVVNAGDISTVDDAIMDRLHVNQGTSLVNGDVTLSAGWGDAATFLINGVVFDSHGEILITPGGSGIAANPFITINYTDGAWPGTAVNAPTVVASRTDAQSPAAGYWLVSSTLTAMTLIFVGTPSTGLQYGVSYIAVGA